MGEGDRRPPSRIPRPHPIADPSPVRFSFKYLDLESNAKFHFGRCEADFIEALFLELKRLSGGTVSDFCEYENDRHSHYIHFQETTEPNGFPGLDEQLESETFWQFGIRPDRPWRVHGFFIDSVFYPVWLDPDHELG